MYPRRRWSPSALSRGDDAGGLSAVHRASMQRNGRYVSTSGALEADSSSRRFVAPPSIDNWRERMSRDADMRAALLNPVDYEPVDER